MEQSEGREFTEGRSEIGQEASPLVSCFWCRRPHPGEHPLSVCRVCAARYSPMRSLNMDGAYPLGDEAIDESLTRASPGNYALGHMDGDTFHVFYVGRSDSDVRQRLHDWVGIPIRHERYGPASGRVWNIESSYTRFAYSYAASAEAAFEKECRNYDDFGGSGELDNEAPPSKEAARAGPCWRIDPA